MWRLTPPDLLLNKAPWRQASQLASLKIFVSVSPDLARKRLVARHLAAGLCATPEEAHRRAVENDLPNGDEIVRLRIEDVDEEVESREDDSWSS
jgi:pantothenate kinase